MKKTRSFIGVCLLLVLGNVAIAQDAAISSDMLSEIRASVAMDAHTRAMQNAVTKNEIRALVLDREKLSSIDNHFAYKIEIPSITDQKSSGRCWLFTALNVMRPKVVERYNLEDFEFSQSYLFFWDQLEKANLFLQAVIETRDQDLSEDKDRLVQWLFQHPIQDGGVWNMMPSLVEKYGLVPKEVYPESHSSENTRQMRTLLRSKLREQGMILRQLARDGKKDKYLQKKKTEMLADIYRMLVICMGTPPTEFQWRYVDKNDSLIDAGSFTPQSFYQQALDVNLNDYVMLMNDPSRPYYQLYEIEYDRNCWEGSNWLFVNLPAEEIKEYAKASILADEAMYFSCDVGKFLERERGIVADRLHDYESLFGIKFAMDKRDRILSYDSGSSHGMALMGVDTCASGKPTKWLLENSWGAEDGFDGYLIMTDDWFEEYSFRLVILKQFLPEKVRKVLEQKPKMLKPWDRMS